MKIPTISTIPIIALLCSLSAFGQAVRLDVPIQTSGPNVPVSGGPLPQTLWVANAKVAVCAHVQPASSQSYTNCLATPTTTYTDSGEGTTCPTTAQLVQLPGTTCTASAGTTANVGFWYAGGIVDYYIVSSYGTFGPYTAAGGSATPSGGTVIATPQFCMYYQPNSGTAAVAVGDCGITTDGSGHLKTVGDTNCITNGTVNVACGISPYTADPTGVADSTAAFAAAIASGYSIHVPAGIYSITGNPVALTMTAFGQSIFGDGRNATVLQWKGTTCDVPASGNPSPNGIKMLVLDGNNETVHDLTIQGVNGTVCPFIGVQLLQGASSVYNAAVQYTYDIAVGIETSNHATVKNNYITNYWYGIHAGLATGAVIEGNTLIGGWKSGGLIPPWEMNGDMERITSAGTGYAVASGLSATTTGTCSNTGTWNITATGAGGAITSLYAATQPVCSSGNGTVLTISQSGGSGGTVTIVSTVGSTYWDGILAEGTQYSVIANNNVTDSGQSGIYMGGYSDTATGNTVTGNTVKYNRNNGIDISGQTGISIAAGGSGYSNSTGLTPTVTSGTCSNVGVLNIVTVSGVIVGISWTTLPTCSAYPSTLSVPGGTGGSLTVAAAPGYTLDSTFAGNTATDNWGNDCNWVGIQRTTFASNVCQRDSNSPVYWALDPLPLNRTVAGNFGGVLNDDQPLIGSVVVGNLFSDTSGDSAPSLLLDAEGGANNNLVRSMNTVIGTTSVYGSTAATIGTSPTELGSTKTDIYPLFSASSAGWQLLGEWVANSGIYGTPLKISCLSGDSTASNAGQAAEQTILVRAGNQSAAPNIAYAQFLADIPEADGGDPISAVSLVDVPGTGLSTNTQWYVYIDQSGFVPGSCAVDISPVDTWTPLGTAASNPGASSSTVYTATNRGNVLTGSSSTGFVQVASGIESVAPLTSAQIVTALGYTPTQVAYGGCSGTATSSSTLYVGGLGAGYNSNCTATSLAFGVPAPVMTSAGTASNLTVRCNATGISTSSGVFTLYNIASGSGGGGAVNTGITLTYGTTASNTAVRDTTHTFSYAAGSLFYVSFTTQASETLGTCNVSFSY